MSQTELVHDTFVLEHRYPVPPASVFTAFADDALKRRWFLIEREHATTEVYENDFRVGGKETIRFTVRCNSP